MYRSSGILQYFTDPLKLVVQVDPDLGNFYRSLIPKYYGVNRPMYEPHISVIRKVVPPNMLVWGKYQDERVDFDYDTYVFNDELYFWLNVYSPRLEEIRSELGVKPFGDVTLSPDGRHKFHITVGNIKK
jgi:hypothetical protein